MRDYAKIAPQFWTRGSGKRLRGDVDAQVLALYLVTCPNANMIGIYYVPIVAIAHETGLGAERTAGAMDRLAVAGFAFYDTEAELAWVPNMASYQIGETVSLKDNRHKGVVAELLRVAGHPFVDSFVARYGEAYALPLPRVPTVAKESLASPLQGPPKGPASHGEEQEQEQEQEQEHICPTSPDGGGLTLTGDSGPARDLRPDDVWSHYVATMKRYRPRRRPTKLRPEDRKAIRKHLDAGLSVADLKLACEGLFRSPHHIGQNDRGTEYLEIEYALRKPATMIAQAENFAVPEQASGTRPITADGEELVDPAILDAELAKLDARFAS